MSRIGKMPIKIYQGIKVSVVGDTVKAEGPKGKLSHRLPSGVSIKIDQDHIHVEAAGKGNLHGVTRSVIHNMVQGVHTGFTKELDVVGVGFRAAVKGQILTLNVGYSHPIDFTLPLGITAVVDKNTHLVISGADRMLVGETAAKIRGFKKPEPYQGKGIKYTDEKITHKEGKAAGTTSAK